jgi:hypothetical protein
MNEFCSVFCGITSESCEGTLLPMSVLSCATFWRFEGGSLSLYSSEDTIFESFEDVV